MWRDTDYLTSFLAKDIIDLNYKKKKKKRNGIFLLKNQIISDDYSKTLFLVRSAALFTEIMPRPRASNQQGFLFRRYKRKLTRKRQH